jgi:hypothetical protein
VGIDAFSGHPLWSKAILPLGSIGPCLLKAEILVSGAFLCPRHDHC